MILILGKDDIVEYIENLRDKIRKEENLQTTSYEISKEDFIRLYNLYGSELAERVFARYVLDISYTTYATLLLGGQNVTNIFSKEKYTAEYIDNLRKTVISKNKLHIDDEISYQDFIRIYNSCEHKLDIPTFASKVLEINYNVLTQLRARKNKKCKVLRRTKFSNTEILQLRELLKEEENIYDNSKIQYTKVLELYEKYGGILDENYFVRKVLEIPKHMHNSARKEPEKVLTIRYREELHLETELRELRLAIAKQYNLHVDDEISKDLFSEIYEKYNINLTEDRFAYDVLGIPKHSLKNMKQNNSKTRIFEQEKLTEQENIEIRNKIIKEEKLKSEDQIDYSRFKQLHEKYGGILSASQFAEDILDIPLSSLKNIKTTNVVILKGEVPDLKTLIDVTNKVMDEYGLKIGDTINYSLFLEIYNKHCGNMSRKQFKEDIFDIYKEFTETNKDINKVIMSSTTILEDYITELRNKVKLENRLCINGYIEKEKFEEIYAKYNDRLNIITFAEKILDIPNNVLYHLLKGTHKKAIMLSKETRDYEYYIQLKEKMIKEFNLHIRDFIDYTQFTALYEKYGSDLIEKEFALLMLNIDEKNYNNVKYIKGAKTRILLGEEISLEQIEELRKFFKQYEGKIINYQQFKELHTQYGGKMDELSFCEQILGFKLGFIKYYKANAAIKDPIAKKEALKIREEFVNIECRFFSSKEIEEICSNKGISVDDFLKYVVLKYNFQFYPETLEAYKKNKGIWFGGKKIGLSAQFIEVHAEKLMNMSKAAIRTISKGNRVPEELVDDIASDVLMNAIERYGELEKNFDYDYEELCKRIYIRMRAEARRELVLHWKMSSKNVSERYYFKERIVGPDIQIGESKESRKVEDEAIDNVDNKRNDNKISLAIKKLSEMEINNEKIGKTLMDYLAIGKIELIKTLNQIIVEDEENKKRNYDELRFVKEIVEEYKKHGVEIDYESAILTFYIKKITHREVDENPSVIDNILITSQTCMNKDREWKEIKQELEEREIEISTIAVASSIYNSFYEGKKITGVESIKGDLVVK